MAGRIVVAGESLVDLIVDATGALRPALGGGPYNTARAIGRLGGQVAFLGCISRDPFGERLLGGLTDDGVDIELVARSEAPTTLALAELDGGAASYRFYVEGTAAPDIPDSWAQQVLAMRPWAVHLGTLGLVFEPIGSSLEHLVDGLPSGTLLMLDPNARASATRDLGAWRARIARLAARATIIRVTTDDLGVLAPGIEVTAAARGLLAGGAGVVLLTDGARPVRILMASGQVAELPVPTVQIVDTVGSGDAFGGAFLAWWQAHQLGANQLGDPETVTSAVREAIRVASVTCTRPGADPPTLAELGGWASTDHPWTRATALPPRS